MKQKIKKEVLEWIILLSVIGIIYFAGWHTELIGRLQQVVLSTGIIQPSELDNEKVASYDFWLEDTEGNKISFESFKGEVIFLNFWATWCPPCIAEMPDIHKLYLSQKNETRFVMISLDQDEEKAKAFIEKREFQFPVYFLRSRIPETFNTHVIPTTYVMDREGMIKIENEGMAKYNSDSFRNLLTELSKRK